MSDEAEDWRWVDVDGAQKPIDEWELVSSLSTGALPAYTLVWRAGWAQWLPACQVAELSSAVPSEHREAPVEPEVDEARTEAPPPPLEKYERYRTRQAASQLLGSRRPPSPATVPPPPPAAGSSAGRGVSAAASLMGKAAGTPPPPPPPPARRPMPTLIEQPVAPSSMTLRPPGAVPPPPRGVPMRPRISSIPEEPKRAASPIDTPIPEIAIREVEAEAEAETGPGVAPGANAAPQAETEQPKAEPAPKVEDLARTQESAEAPVGLAKAAGSADKAGPVAPPSELPTGPRAATAPLVPPEALPSWSAELDAASEPNASPGPPVTAPAPAAAPTPAPATPAGGARFPVALVGLGALALVLGVIVVVLLATRSNKLNPLRTAGSVGASATASASPRQACTLTLPAHRLASSILRSIPPYIASTPDGSRVAVGVAASRTSALGLLVGPTTLSVARAFARNGHSPLLGVVPTTASGKIGFAVTRSDGPLGFARTVDAKPPFMLGMSDTGLARVVGSGQPQVLWPGGTGEHMTEIRVATTPAGEHAVAFRRGGQSGQVLVGWLGPDGARKSALSPVSGGRFLGTPMVAANKKSILVVFASRDDRQAEWGVRLAAAPNGEAPSGSQDFAIPAGGPGDEAISPAAAGLGDDHWLLQWTEGSRGHHEVRVQPLGADLAPAGPPITVSPKEANAGQGVVWVRGGKAISLFLITQGRRLELWGAALSCP